MAYLLFSYCDTYSQHRQVKYEVTDSERPVSISITMNWLLAHRRGFYG